MEQDWVRLALIEGATTAGFDPGDKLEIEGDFFVVKVVTDEVTLFVAPCPPPPPKELQSDFQAWLAADY